jgi:nucleoside-diphosphate-sugar epimerase
VILVTGSNGFVGSALCRTLRARALAVRGAVRRAPGQGQVAVGDLAADTDWQGALQGCSCVLHVAARVHVMDDQDADPLAAYRAVNVDATLNLARQAHAAGVRRFVFVSSIKVNGESTSGRAPYTAQETPLPVDPYGVSKLEAELALQAYAASSGLELVIVRPPLVYGPGVKANFRNLIKLVQRGWPLPFGMLRNRRSMVALDNLVDLLILCTQHPAAPGRVLLVSDGADLTMGERVTLIAGARQQRLWLLPVPAALLRAVAGVLGKAALADRLLDSLQVDIAPTCSALEWQPVVTPHTAIATTVADFLSVKNS